MKIAKLISTTLVILSYVFTTYAQNNSTYYLKEIKGVFKNVKTKNIEFEKIVFSDVTIEYYESNNQIIITGTDLEGKQVQKMQLNFDEYYIHPQTNKPNGEMIMRDKFNKKYFVIFSPNIDKLIAVFPNPEKVVNGLTYFMIGNNITSIKSW